MLNHSIVVTALASFLALGTQSAFADPAAMDATSTTAAAPAAVSDSAQAGTQVGISMPASAVQTGRPRHAARIPGTFTDAQDQAYSVSVLLTPLSGDGGG